jgi:NADH-ubiquinone oxidoreductase chain 5
MSHDPHNQRFFSYLSLFTFMMIILVTANNFLLMFVGWEGVGICSYLLVCFWFTRIAANQSSLAAFFTNRVGDCFLTIGMFIILWSFGNIDYTTVFSLAPYINENIITIIGICLLIGAMAKSSQVGLHVWLPMAMEGPTPVSALIHAATMVTAGVYLLIRSSPLIEYSTNVLLLCLWIGAVTTVFSSLIGLFQQDIKKVIAYSTMSQLGMMVIAIGLSCYNVALFHLVNHAFYKGLLFLGAGSVIHAVADNQDFRKYGGLRSFLPLTYSVMLIASLSLVAFPFMSGFYSKDFILESAFGEFYFSSTVIYAIATIGAMFTTLYSVKVLYLTFLTSPAGPLVNYKQAHEGNIFMSFPLIVLAIFSIIFGYLTKDIFIGLGSDIFTDNSIYIHPLHEITLDTEFAVPVVFKILPLIFTISLSFVALIISEFISELLITFKLSNLGYNIFGFFNQRFFIELFYNRYITDIVLKLGSYTTKTLDKGSVELIGPFGLEKGLIYLSKIITNLNKGFVTYGLYIFFGLIFFILLTYITESNHFLLSIITVFGLINININSIESENSYSKLYNNNVYLKGSINKLGIRSFSSSSAYLSGRKRKVDEASDISSVPELDASRAAGPADTSTIPDTLTENDVDYGTTREQLDNINATNREIAQENKEDHDAEEEENSRDTDEMNQFRRITGDERFTEVNESSTSATYGGIVNDLEGLDKGDAKSYLDNKSDAYSKEVAALRGDIEVGKTNYADIKRIMGTEASSHINKGDDKVVDKQFLHETLNNMDNKRNNELTQAAWETHKLNPDGSSPRPDQNMNDLAPVRSPLFANTPTVDNSRNADNSSSSSNNNNNNSPTSYVAELEQESPMDFTDPDG